jgi:diguanylate cyclase (GGDEF)-like protein
VSLDQSIAAEDRFSFETEMPVTEPHAGTAPTEVLNAQRTVRALALARQVSYHWDVVADLITWSANTKSVLGFDPAQVRTGRQFAAIMDGDNFFSRYDTVLRSSQHDVGDGVAYEIEYRLRSDAKLGTASPWIEDQGRWFAGQDGSPMEALGVMRIADERHQRDQEMNFLSNCDPLTGMMNRSRMTDALGEAISVATNDKQPCAFAIVAVNNLDVMNEAYGFEVADEVIVSLGNRLRQVMRTGDGIARYSGSKFGVILNACKPEELNAALERFMRAVRDSVIETKLGPVWALLSIGAVSLPALGDNASTAIAHAEEALSEAFRLPGDGYVVFTSSTERENLRLVNARCATEIVNCLRDGLFKLAFQPVFNAKTGEVFMHEALLRMEDSSGTLITAGHLVPIAERLGLIRLIDRAVLQLALQTLQTYAEARLSINISATTVTDPRWNAQLLDMVAAAVEPASRLVVEITETAALDNLPTSHDFVSSLRSLGCGVALDDFGAGYTSYRNLKELPISLIKLDGSFCCNLAEGGENHTFVRSMLELAHAFDLKVVAEWVDTKEDAEILSRHGVDYLQGNMLGQASIVAPWAAANDHGFQLASSSLAPVDIVHFQHSAPDITTPHAADLVVADEKAVDDPANATLAASPEATEPVMTEDAREQDIVAVEIADDTSASDTTAAPDVDDHLSELRAALSALSAAFGQTSSGAGEEARIAS